MVGKIVGKLFISLVVITVFIYGYSFLEAASFVSMSNNYAEFQSLLNRPGFYTHKHICTAGTYYEGFENSILRDLGNKASEDIWIEAPVEKTLLGKVQEWLRQFKQLSNSNRLVSTVKICGTFEYIDDDNFKFGSGFGYMNGFKYQISK